MKMCLSPEILEALANRQYRDLDMFEILQHLESCEKCRSKLRRPTTKEILERLENDDLPPTRAKKADD